MQNIRSNVAKHALVLSFALAGLINSAAAALPASVATTMTSIKDDGQSVFDLVFPVVGFFLGLALIIKLFKRFANKV